MSGVSTTFSKPLGTEVKELNTQMANFLIVVKAGEVLAGQSKTVAYPTGYSNTNAYSLNACFTNYAGTDKYFDNKNIQISLTSSGIVFTNNESFNTYIETILCKTFATA